MEPSSRAIYETWRNYILEDWIQFRMWLEKHSEAKADLETFMDFLFTLEELDS